MAYATWRCTGKQAFANKAEAQRHLRTLEKRKRVKKGWTGGGKINAYHCVLCDSWHVGYDAVKR